MSVPSGAGGFSPGAHSRMRRIVVIEAPAANPATGDQGYDSFPIPDASYDRALAGSPIYDQLVMQRPGVVPDAELKSTPTVALHDEVFHTHPAGLGVVAPTGLSKGVAPWVIEQGQPDSVLALAGPAPERNLIVRHQVPAALGRLAHIETDEPRVPTTTATAPGLELARRPSSLLAEMSNGDAGWLRLIAMSNHPQAPALREQGVTEPIQLGPSITESLDLAARKKAWN